MFARQEQTRLEARRRMHILTVLFLLAIATVLGIGVYVLLSVDITPEPALVEEQIPNDRFF
jgi:hypothetical protein